MQQLSVAFFLPNLGVGGAERVALHLANEFVRRGYRVALLLLNATGELLSELNPAIEVISLHASRIRHGLFPLGAYLRRHAPDVLLASMWPLTGMAIVAQRLSWARTRVLAIEHTHWSASFHHQRWPRSSVWIRIGMRLLFPHAHAVLAVFQGVADDVRAFARLPGKTAVQVMYNPVVSDRHVLALQETDSFEPSAWWHGSHRRLLAVGNLKWEKDYAVLLRAFAQLHARMAVKLLILGEGPCRLALQDEIRHLGLSEAVFMPGVVMQVTPYYQRAELFVLSSRCEGLALVVVEALACGTPVVSTDCRSGPREILSHDRLGRLVPVGDVNGLAEAMRLSLETSEHDVAAMRARAADFSIRKVADAYEQIFMDSRGL